jgi:hypothetical protein
MMAKAAQHIMPRHMVSYERQAPEEENQENQKLRVLRAMLEEERAKNERATRCIVDLHSALCQALQENENQQQDMSELLQICEQIHEDKLDLLLKCTTNAAARKAQRKRAIVSVNSLVEELLEEQKEEQRQAMTAMKENMNQEQELKQQAYQTVIKDLISKNALLMALQEKKKIAQGSSMIKKRSPRARGKTRRSTSVPNVFAVSAVSSNCSRGKMTSHPSSVYADRQAEDRLNGDPSKINHDRNSQHKKGIVQLTGADSDSRAVDKPSDKTKRDQGGPLLRRSERRLLQRRRSDYLAQYSETDEAAHISQDDMSLMTYNRLSSDGTAQHARAMSDDDSDDCSDVLDRKGISSNNTSTITGSRALKSSTQAAQRNIQVPRVSHDGIIKATRSEIAFGSTPSAGGAGGDLQQLRRRERP